VLTAIKPADAGDGFIVRCYNSSERAQSGHLTLGFPVASVEPVNLLEETQGEALPIEDEQRVTVEVPPKRIVTLRVVPAR